MTKLERTIGSKIVVQSYGAINSTVHLLSGNQSFQIGPVTVTTEAQWMRRQLRKALVNLVNEVKP